MATVLMTGATGLIGARVAASWKPDDGDLEAVGRKDLDLLAPGVLASHVARIAPDVFLHLAWTAGGTRGYRDSPENALWSAVSREVAQQCLSSGIRFVGTGTVLDDHEGTDAYTKAKRDLRESLAGSLSAGRATWLRPYYVFDPEGDRPAVLGAARAAVAANRTPRLRHPNAAHDFIHVGDVARAVRAAVVSGLTGVVDVGSGTVHRVADLVTRAGFSWEQAPDGDQVLHHKHPADTAPLRETGWAPTDTERFFGP